ncbi:DUF4034 domain-containing protein [Lysobacter sp. LF1]|uniref:DUF4034 domain-containing protein n=1 Tax=Lysobacter stagni TaxID=3045172 RepID=A0ABT6XHC6_9GAMM|nr:DUF4034 domain-containing protein [Lysobacter sp. LF1]MDI9239565.1 DUF4034 domain-containing protein [Lysobacter sp. LF1]
MKGIRFALAGLLLAASVAPVCAYGNTGVPPQWAKYVEQVRAADAIADMEARCLAYPDLPGNQWPAGAAQAQCALLRKPLYSLDDIERLSATAGGRAELEHGFRRLMKQSRRKGEHRDQMFASYAAFDASERAGQVAKQWLERAPESSFAMLAGGVHYAKSGAKARGRQYASQTSDEQFDRMHEAFAEAMPLLLRAQEREPRLSVACYWLSYIGRNISKELQRQALAHCEKVDPDSYYVALERIRASEPRWGGSSEALDEAVALAAKGVRRNPALGGLLGRSVGYRFTLGGDFPADLIVPPTRMGPNADLLGRAGRSISHTSFDPNWEDIVYLSQAVRFDPDDEQSHYIRAWVLVNRYRDPLWARADSDAALRLDPNELEYVYLRGRIAQNTEGVVAARPYYQKAMAVPKHHRAALIGWCSSFDPAQEPDMADDCSRQAATEFPTAREALLLRARALYITGRPGALEAVKQFLMADEIPMYLEEAAQMRNEWLPRLQGDKGVAERSPAASSGQRSR